MRTQDGTFHKKKQMFQNFLALAKARKTTYEFSRKTVAKKDILTILETARWTPSCGNIQPWHFIVVRNKKTIKQLIQKTHFVFAPFIKPFPPVIIAFVLPSEEEIAHAKECFCCPFEECKQHRDDQERCLSMAVLQAVLAATELGIASCILTPSEETSQLLKVHQIGKVLLLVALGYEKKNAFQKQRSRIELKQLISYEHYGKKQYDVRKSKR